MGTYILSSDSCLYLAVVVCRCSVDDGHPFGNAVKDFDGENREIQARSASEWDLVDSLACASCLNLASKVLLGVARLGKLHR